MTSVTGTEFGSKTLVYDDESRLTRVTYPTGTESFVYNALGQRMKLSENYVVTRYVYDGDRVLEETNNAGTVLARYTTAAGSYYAPLLHIWRVSDSLSRFPMYDLAGSVRGLLDAAGGVTDTYTLEAFGKQRSSTGSTPNPYRFGGAWGYINGVSGLQQLGARFYWPEIGRFIQQDPIGDGMNWYGYTGGNPVVWADPEGLHLTESMWHNLRHWDCTWVPGLKQGAAILADTVNILGNPYMDAGAYDPKDPYIAAARVSAGVGVGAAAAAGVLAGAQALGVQGANPWLGAVARHGAHHGRGPHIQVMVRVGKHATRTLARIKWPPWRGGR